MLRRALASLTPSQKTTIKDSCKILAVEVPTIELAGGSVRCMIAGIHLSLRPRTSVADGISSAASSPAKATA
ncbi:arginine deiminase-related protein [Paenarthrobacter sp. A20]|uniref:arginine deiminase-related protein n=1 Tax=Paenarthrobacter sp. A20 TaxID=2817891 RepID=UPI0035A9077C|nr:hypothetical protein [Paenarthrobacter sp. A20]